MLRLPDPRAHRLAADGLGDHDGVVGGAVHEVLRAVDRVDGERVLGREVAVHERVVGGVRLLAEHDGIRVGRGEPVGDEHLRLAVGDGDEVAGVLLGHLAGRERAEAGGDDLGGDLTQEVEDGVARQTGHGRNGHTAGAAHTPNHHAGARAGEAPRDPVDLRGVPLVTATC